MPVCSRNAVWLSTMGVVAVSTAMLSAQPCQPYWASVTADLAIQPREDSLFPFNDGSGSALYASGAFNFGGPTNTYSVARWRGHGWEMLNVGLPQGAVSPAGPWIRVLDEGSGPSLFAFGSYSNYPNPGRTLWNAKWTGSMWISAPAFSTSTTSPVASFVNQGQPAIFGLTSNGIQQKVVRWTDSGWITAGDPGPSGYVTRLKVVGSGSSAALIAIGSFATMNGAPARGIAKWDGVSWSGFGSGIGLDCRDVAFFDDGSEPGLYVVGAGSEAGGVLVHNIAKWDGSQWSDVGGGTSGCASCPSILYAAQVFDDGRGPALYVTGYVVNAGGVPVRGIARWDGAHWSALGAGINGSYADYLAVYDDGRGPSLFVSETYAAGAGTPHGIAHWIGCPNCYANCDNSNAPPRLNVNDFICFLTKYAALDPYANCNVDSVIDINDFACFMTKFAQGCP